MSGLVKVYALVKEDRGIIEDVVLYLDDTEAEHAFYEWSGLPYADIAECAESGGLSQYSGTAILEVEIEPKAGAQKLYAVITRYRLIREDFDLTYDKAEAESIAAEWEAQGQIDDYEADIFEIGSIVVGGKQVAVQEALSLR